MAAVRRGRRVRARGNRFSRFRRRRGAYRSRRRLFHRRRKTGNLVCYGKYTTFIGVTNKEDTSVPIAPRLDHFKELEDMSSRFESFQMVSVKVRVTPTFNVSGADKALSPYYSAPYHRPFPADLKQFTQSILSIDKSRTHHACSTMTRSFVPAIHVSQFVETGGAYTPYTYKWKPVIENTATSDKIPHYCGIIIFPKTTSNYTNPVTYAVQFQIKVIFRNQVYFQ